MKWVISYIHVKQYIETVRGVKIVEIYSRVTSKQAKAKKTRRTN